MNIPARDLRSNIATFAVPLSVVPAVARNMIRESTPEIFDTEFKGQALETTYFDTRQFALRRARARKKKYLTLRIRCYRPSFAYALSAKTETEKFRTEISPGDAEAALAGDPTKAWESLPAHLISRLYDLAGDDFLIPVATVSCRRFAVENKEIRFTLDLDIATDTGKRLETSILEMKSTDPEDVPPPWIHELGLRPVKLSKFLWATSWR